MKTKKTFLIYAILMLGIVFAIITGCKKDSNVENNTVKDIDGNVYHTVTIGTQVWMLENLRTTKYRNGESIPNVIDNDSWDFLLEGAYCNYNHDPSYVETYGRLYNWYAVIDPRNICPEGWHIPTDNDWDILIDFLGGEDVAGGKLKETGTTHWLSPNNGATNESGFGAIPGGYHGFVVNGSFEYLGKYGQWWSATRYDTIHAWYRRIPNSSSSVIRYYNDYNIGNSIRCIKD